MKIDTMRLWYFQDLKWKEKKEKMYIYMPMIPMEMIVTESGQKKRTGIPKITGFSRMDISWALHQLKAFP